MRLRVPENLRRTANNPGLARWSGPPNGAVFSLHLIRDYHTGDAGETAFQAVDDPTFRRPMQPRRLRFWETGSAGALHFELAPPGDPDPKFWAAACLLLPTACLVALALDYRGPHDRHFPGGLFTQSVRTEVLASVQDGGTT